jgi:hypothetical protein
MATTWIEAITAALGDDAREAAKKKRKDADERKLRDRMHAEKLTEISLGKAK